MRERRPGVFEIRVAVGVDPVSGRTVQRSFWFHGTVEDAGDRRSELAAQFAEYRSLRRAAPFLTVGELLERWLAAQHDWRPSTWSSARSNAKALTGDPIANRRVSTLRPEVVRVAMARWRESGATVSVVSGRFRVLRSAVGWAQSESIIDRNPLRDMRGPPRPGTRMHVPVADVLALIEMSERWVEKAEAALDGSVGSLHAFHKTEQVQLLVRLAADSGARRGELAALRFGDLDGRVLTIERGVSGEEVGPTKTRQVRRLSLGRTTVELWRVSEAAWRRRAAAGNSKFGDWLFSRDLDHGRRLTTSGLGHWFAELRDEAGLEGVSLHRLRHTVATYLVGRGDLLQAQQRLGHRDASTTLRNYAHAMPLEDEAVADDIDEMLRTSGNL
ncbi:MAG: tyrosine-type recombinase/integrase [Acidimicrobiales bacterium]|nr:tyrosine-type recombinase/integrase [Acidimicrobiales bacterium]